MKIRLRFQKDTKGLLVPEHLETSYTLSAVRNVARQIFSEDLSQVSQFGLSLNNADVLTDESKTFSDYGIVAGDLVYIIVTDYRQPESQPSPCTSEASNSSLAWENAQLNSAANLDISGTSVDSEGLPPSPSCSAGVQVNSDLDSAMAGELSSYPGMEEEDQQREEEEAMVEEGEEESVPLDLVVVRQYLSEPVLCRDTTESAVPALLNEAYLSLQPEDEVEALCVVLHVMMLEVGYAVVSQGSEATNSSSRTIIAPEKWRFPGHCRFQYTYQGCNSVTALLTLVAAGSSLIVHGKVAGEDVDQNRQVVVKPEDYVEFLTPDAVGCYSNLTVLSMKFKDAVALPLLHDMRLTAGLPDVYGFMALTQELKLRVLSFLDVASLVRVSEVNSELVAISQDPYLWRRHYLREVGNKADNSLSQDWLQLYISRYKARKLAKKMLNRPTYVSVLPPVCVPPLHPWIPPTPGMIGGDYDAFPQFPGVLPGAPGRFGLLNPIAPRPRLDLIGPQEPDLELLPQQPGRMRGLPGRGRGMPLLPPAGPRMW